MKRLLIVFMLLATTLHAGWWSNKRELTTPVEPNSSLVGPTIITPRGPSLSVPGGFPLDITYSHNGKWATVGVTGPANRLSVYQVICPTGRFEPHSENVPLLLTPNIFAYSPNDAFFALPESSSPPVAGSTGDVTVYSVNCDTGELTPIQTLSATLNNPEILNPFSVAYSPDGRFAAVTNQGVVNPAPPPNALNGNISVYKVNKVSGLWTLIQVLPFGSDVPVIVAYAPDGRSAAATFFNTTGGRSFTVNPATGLFSNATSFLTSSNSTPGPFSLVYSHEEHGGVFFASVTNQNVPSVATFTVDPATGIFTMIQEIPLPSVQFVAYSPTDEVAAVTDPVSGNVDAYCVDQTTGAFIPPGQMFHISDPQASPFAIAFAPCSDVMATTDPSATQIEFFTVHEDACAAL